MSHRLVTLYVFILTVMSVQLKAEDKFAHELSVRTGFLALGNKGEQGGSASGGSGINVNYSFFLNSKWALTASYETSFDLGTESIPVTGYALGAKYYYKGFGTESTYTGDWGHSEYSTIFSGYVGATLGTYEYFLGRDNLSIDTESANLEGRYMNINLLTGIDYKLTKKYELNGEAGYSLFAFAASDNRVKLAHMYVYFGITFIF